MTTTKITSEQINKNSVASLPTRPTESTSFGGKGYTSEQMKAAFDRLPKLVIERFNLLLSDITDGQILEDIPTDLEQIPTLKELVDSIENEKLSYAITVFGTSLRSFLLQLRNDVDALISKENSALGD